MRNTISAAEFEFLDSLSSGDCLEVVDKANSRKWRGAVEEIAPRLGVFWVRTAFDERKMLDIRDHFARHITELNLN